MRDDKPKALTHRKKAFVVPRVILFAGGESAAPASRPQPAAPPGWHRAKEGG